jgi:hypothetical protein
MRKILATLVLVLAASLVMGWASEEEIDSPAAQDGAEKPNIVLILVDDMRADDLEYMPKTQRLISAPDRRPGRRVLQRLRDDAPMLPVAGFHPPGAIRPQPRGFE